MSDKIYAPAMAAVLMSLCSCEKELDFRYHDIEPIQVIEAQLTQDGARVTLTRTTPMDEPMDRQPLTDAAVTIADLTDGTETGLTPDCEGTFVSAAPGMEGHTYRLIVTMDGNTYTAESLMERPSEITGVEFNWIKMPYDHVAVLQVSFLDISPEPGNCYWVRLYRNGEAYMWAPVSDSSASGDTIREVFMTTRMDLDQEDEDTILRDGDVVTVTVAPVSKAFADYLQAIASDSNGPCMFSGPLCLGYFLAAPIASETIVFHPDEIPYY
ncbi:MAG: DUF4249 family protein [Muribaculaceae bacterium]|nr:DUF4249 family protein [Muribaculaceae bacterium]